MQPFKAFDPSYDYSQDIDSLDIRTEGDSTFVYLRGLEKLAKARGVKAATCERLMVIPNGTLCTYRFEFLDGGKYDGSADATTSNCDGNFALYTAAMAESRAKARALRTAFGITLCSVEEKSSKSLIDDKDLGPVEDHQSALIRHLMDKHGLGKADVIKMLDIPRVINKVEDLNRLEAKELIKKINSLKVKKEKAIKTAV